MNLRKKWDNFMYETEDILLWDVIKFTTLMGLLIAVTGVCLAFLAWLLINVGPFGMLSIFLGVPITALIIRVLLQKEQI